MLSAVDDILRKYKQTFQTVYFRIVFIVVLQSVNE